MDTYKWININPKVNFEKIQKKYYNRFVIKLIYILKGARSIAYVQSHYELELRLKSWLPNSEPPNDEQLTYFCYLKKLFDLINEIKQVAKVRINSDYVSIFGDEDVLEKIAHGSLAPFKHLLHTVCLAANQTEQQLINEGYVILRQPTNFKYRVNLRQGLYTQNSLLSLVEYANNIPEEIKMTENFKYCIVKHGNKYCNGNYFYIKDLKILDMIMLIDPKLVKSYQKIKVIQ